MCRRRASTAHPHPRLARPQSVSTREQCPCVAAPTGVGRRCTRRPPNPTRTAKPAPTQAYAFSRRLCSVSRVAPTSACCQQATTGCWFVARREPAKHSQCPQRTRDPVCGLVVVVEAECPICLALETPIVALPCGHTLCMHDFQALGGILPAARKADGARERENKSEFGASSRPSYVDASPRSARAPSAVVVGRPELPCSAARPAPQAGGLSCGHRLPNVDGSFLPLHPVRFSSQRL